MNYGIFVQALLGPPADFVLKSGVFAACMKSNRKFGVLLIYCSVNSTISFAISELSGNLVPAPPNIEGKSPGNEVELSGNITITSTAKAAPFRFIYCICIRTARRVWFFTAQDSVDNLRAQIYCCFIDTWRKRSKNQEHKPSC